MKKSIIWHSQNSWFNYFQGYLGILRDIDAYSATLIGAQLGGRGAREVFPALFENPKQRSCFGNEGPDCVYWSALVPQAPPTQKKNLVEHLHSGIIIFTKHSILNVCQSSEYSSINNCSVILTVTLCYVLHQTHSEFWRIHHAVFSGIYWHIQLYSVSLRNIHVY